MKPVQTQPNIYLIQQIAKKKFYPDLKFLLFPSSQFTVNLVLPLLQSKKGTLRDRRIIKGTLRDRRIMPRVTQLLRRARKPIQDLDLLKVLESELNHELSSIRFQGDEVGSLGDFVLEWDSPLSQDVLLRKKCSSGEEVAVSALLGSEAFQRDSKFPREALMKVCVKKPDFKTILRFDCVACSSGDNRSDFDIQNAHYIQSSSRLHSSFYRGPIFSELDPALQHELKQYLAARGIEENLTNFLILHLHKKEQDQYMKWLNSLKDVMSNVETSTDQV